MYLPKLLANRKPRSYISPKNLRDLGVQANHPPLSRNFILMENFG